MVKKLVFAGLLAALLAGPAAPSLAAAQDEEEKSGGCVTFLLDCYAMAWEYDGIWEKLAAVTACDQLYLQCVRIKVIGF